jgi:hypothetical protein
MGRYFPFLVVSVMLDLIHRVGVLPVRATSWRCRSCARLNSVYVNSPERRKHTNSSVKAAASVTSRRVEWPYSNSLLILDKDGEVSGNAVLTIPFHTPHPFSGLAEMP